MYTNYNTPYGEQVPQNALPPGIYKYSNNFPKIMNDLSPSYTVQTEPVFFDHLLMHNGKNVRVVTVGGLTFEGVVSGVAIDHVQLTINGVNYHIRFQNIIYFRKV